MKPGSGALVALDCDGVLFDSFEANVAFYNAMLAELGEPLLDDEGREHAHRMSSAQIIDWLFAERPERIPEARRIARELDYAPFLPLMRPVRALDRTLAWLRENYRTAMATNRGTTIPTLVEHFSLGPWFETIVGIYDVPQPKPAPDMLLLCLSRLGVAAASSVYVGDSPGDRQAAAEAGMHFVAVGDGSGGPATIGELAELPEYLKARFS